jgi:ferritin-like metal-binding protein YciE
MSPQHETTQQDHAVVAKYLLEAHGKECQLETALKGQLALVQRPPVQHALRDHLGVTRRQIGALERRIDELGGAPSHGFGVVATVVESVVGRTGSVVNRGMALAKSPLQALRGTSPADNELRSLRDCYWNEAEEIAHYRVIETLANELGDTETAELAARHRAEEEEMQQTLEGLIPGAVRGVVASEASPDAAQAPKAQAPAAAAEAKPSEPTSPAAPPAAAPKAEASEATKPAASASAAEPKAKAAKPAARVKKATPKPAAAPKGKPHVKPLADAPDLAEPQVSTSELLERALAPKPIPGQPAETPVAPTAAELATAAIADSDATPEA